MVVIGIEPEWTNLIADGIAETGKPVAAFSIERTGDIGTIAAASWKAKEFVQWASELHPVEVDMRRNLGFGQMRRVGHHFRPGFQPHRGQRHRQAGRGRLHLLVR